MDTHINTVSFDDQTNKNAGLEDLDISLLKAYLHNTGDDSIQAIDPEKYMEILKKLNMIGETSAGIKPKNVALLFFCPEPHKFIPGSRIDVLLRLRRNNKESINESFAGPIDFQLKSALQYINNMVISEMVVKYPDRAEADRFFNYPYIAVKEALVNAVCQKAYDIDKPITISVDYEKIDILSYPGLNKPVSISSLSHCRNPRISKLLKHLHDFEGENAGADIIRQAMHFNGSPQPEYESDYKNNCFVTRLYCREGFIKK